MCELSNTHTTSDLSTRENRSLRETSCRQLPIESGNDEVGGLLARLDAAIGPARAILFVELPSQGGQQRRGQAEQRERDSRDQARRPRGWKDGHGALILVPAM